MIEYFKDQIDNCEDPVMVLWYCELDSDGDMSLERFSHSKKHDQIHVLDDLTFVEYTDIAYNLNFGGTILPISRENVPVFRKVEKK